MASPSNPTVHTKLDLSDSSSYLPSNLFQPRANFFNRKQSTPGVQQLLLRRNRLDSLRIYAKALSQLKQHLNELSLRENNFVKFPIEVTVLKNLTSLSLANNQLEVIESDTLAQLPNLQWLNLSHNQLRELPVDLVCCHYLRGLDLENNNFTTFPEVIFYLTRLEVLMIQKNKIKALPANYDFSPTIHTLNLAFNQFTQVPATLLTKPPQALTHLHLSGNKLKTLPPKFLSGGACPKLISLDFHTCQLSRISSKIFERLSKCKDLRRLNLAINLLTDIPPEIGLLSQLQWLNLNDNLLTALPSTMADLIHLVKLGLVQNRIEILPPFMFLHMLELQKLDIRRNHLKYMPPSILALAPRQEVDIHVDLAAPHAVFQTLSTTACPTDAHVNVLEQACMDCHPYGGSLRTLLFYENPMIEHVDGVLCDLGCLGEEEEEEQEEYHNSPESVQAMSMTRIYSLLQYNPSPSASKSILRQALIPQEEKKQQKKDIMYCNHPKFRRSDNPMPNMLSEIDDEVEPQHVQDSDANEEEKDSIRTETQRLLTRVLSLRELTLRTHLTATHQALLQKQHNTLQRLDQDPDKAYLFIKSVLPSAIVPNMMQVATMQSARQCDFCTCWYTDSKLQIGYLARLCNNRLQIPIRFNVCSTDCLLEAVIKLYQTTIDWHTRQSLAHIDATLLLPQHRQQQQQQQQEPIRRGGSAVNYWHVGLASSSAASTSATVRRLSTNQTLGTRASSQDDVEEEEQQISPTSAINRSTSASSSDTTLSSTLSAHQSSLARTIRNRVTQFASTFFSHNQQQPELSRASSSSSSSGSSSATVAAARATTVETNNNELAPLVFPNWGLGVNRIVQPQLENLPPPSLTSFTSRIVEGRLQTEQTQPQLRLAAPTLRPTAFNHLPRDAIRLEKF